MTVENKPIIPPVVPNTDRDSSVPIQRSENLFGFDPDTLLSARYSGKDGSEKTIWDLYPFGTDYEKKYRIARSLIDDGRIFAPDFQESIGHSPAMLLTKFAPFKTLVPPHEQEQVEKMRQELYVLLKGNGVITVDEYIKVSEEDTEAALERIIVQDPDLQQLIGVVDMPVLGAIANALLFQHLPTAEREEAMRAMTTRALIRPYLGDIVVNRSGHVSGDFGSMFQRLPEKIFHNPESVTDHIALNFVENHVLKLFNEGAEKGFEKLTELMNQETNALKKDYLQRIQSRLTIIANRDIPASFRTMIPGVYEDKEVPFPHMRQRYIVDEFTRPERNEYAKQKRLLLNGGTGSGKTATAFIAMQESGATRPVIFGPANARDTWPHEAKKVFTEDSLQEQPVFAIRGARDFYSKNYKNAEQFYLNPTAEQTLKSVLGEGVFYQLFPEDKRASKPSSTSYSVSCLEDIFHPALFGSGFVYVAAELIGQMVKKPDFEILKTILTTIRNSDGVVIDEAHTFRSLDAQSTQGLIDIVRGVEKQKKKSDPNEDIPIIALTATPLVSSLQDYDVMMGLLYPEEFGITKTDKHASFSAQCGKNPHVVFTKLFGNRLMMRVSTQDIFGDKVPEYHFNVKNLQMGSYERMIYEWVHSQEASALNLMHLQRTTILDPKIVVNSLLQNGHKPETNFSKTQVSERIGQLYEEWKSSNQDEPFNFDWITEHNGGDMLLHVLFDREQFPNGLVEFMHTVDGFDDIKQLWPKDFPTPRTAKYRMLYNYLTEHYSSQIDTITRKTFIISPEHKEGITDSQGHWSLKEQVELWLADRDINVHAIDGDVDFKKRRELSEKWRTNGDDFSIFLGVLKTVYESLDFAVRDTPENAHIKDIDIIMLGWPWDHHALEQVFGRFFRPGMDLHKNITCTILNTETTIDEGLRDTVEYKRLLNLMATFGVQLSHKEKEFFDEKQRRSIHTEDARKQAELRWMMQRLKGSGEDNSIDFLSKSTGDQSGFQKFIESYFDGAHDIDRIVGNNARLVWSLLRDQEPSSVLSIGAGSCLLARTIAEEIDYPTPLVTNLDINKAAMQKMKLEYPEIATYLVSKASNLTEAKDISDNPSPIQNDSFDAVDMSFMLDWTKNNLHGDISENERIKVLSEAHRVLKPGGTLAITLPESTFDDPEDFIIFALSLQDYFGFEIDTEHSGPSWTKDIKPNRRIGWSLLATKVAPIDLTGFDPNFLTFHTDPQQFISTKKVSPVPVLKPKENKPISLSLFHAEEFDIESMDFGNSSNSITNLTISNNEPDSNVTENTFTPIELIQQPESDIQFVIKGTEILMPYQQFKSLVEPIAHRYSTLEEAERVCVDIINTHGRVKNNQLDYRQVSLLLDCQTSWVPRISLEGLSHAKNTIDKNTWKDLRKYVENEIGCNYEESEYLLAGTIYDLNNHIPLREYFTNDRDFQNAFKKYRTSIVSHLRMLSANNII